MEIDVVHADGTVQEVDVARIPCVGEALNLASDRSHYRLCLVTSVTHSPLQSPTAIIGVSSIEEGST
jgi:hypothetical protein